MGSALRKAVLLLALLAIAGCAPLSKTTKSPLASPQLSSDSVVLEMFFVRVPFGDAAVNGKLWDQIDEQPLAPELRQRLTRNGFRAGLLGNEMPEELSKLLELADKPAPTQQTEGAKVEQMDAEPRVTRRHLQLRAGQRSEILASSIYPQLPVLVHTAGQLSGQTYTDAQGLFAAKSFPQPDGRVRLELVPELHHGEPRQRWVGGQGMLRLETGRAKQVYEDMTLTADLAPGAMLVLTCLPNRAGSLGHHFFTQSEGRLEQKLLLIRLSQTQHDGLFNPPESLKLEDKD
ncbi:MAG: hypothetical protein LLG00_08215 [Planctomycetaceae bacterium]|nr:hypothetical protein [Planctomycetaceae bacterium]